MNEIVSLDKVFSDRVFQVPDYQRGYAWEAQQRLDLLEDLEDLPEKKDHYVGTLVLQLRGDPLVDAEGAPYQQFDVVDGQQRLTTLVILLSVIARALKQTSKVTLGEGIHKRFVATKDEAGQPFYKLRLAKEQHTFFTEAVLPDAPTYAAAAKTAAEHRLLTAREEFTTYVDEHRKTESEFERWLQTLQTKITRSIRMSVYPVEDSADVGIIFEVMNNRGRALTELEKVKNYLLYMATRLSVPTDALRDQVNHAWADIYERLMGAGLSGAEHEDQLLRAHWVATVDHNAKAWRGSRSIKERFQLKKFRDRDPDRDRELQRKLVAAVADYVKTLCDASVPFVDAHSPTHSDAFRAFQNPELVGKARRWGEKISRMWVLAPFVPMLIATRLRAPAEAQATIDLLELCERFAFRVYRWGEFRSHTGQSRLFHLAHRRYNQEITDADLLDQLRGLLHYYNGELAFAEELKEQALDEHNDWYQWTGLRYFLYEWEQHCAQGAAVPLSWGEVTNEDLAKTVEHILPQSPTAEYWQQHFGVADRKRYTHDIGNLVLTQYNPSLSNKGFDDKKGLGSTARCYANSGIASERALASLTQWDVATLKARRAKIVEWALGRWSVKGSAVAVTPVHAEDDDG